VIRQVRRPEVRGPERDPVPSDADRARIMEALMASQVAIREIAERTVRMLAATATGASDPR
jgi:hypothetical protein